MAFRKKWQQVITDIADLDCLVIQECEHKDKLELALSDVDYNEIMWYGDNPHKGLAIISFRDVHIRKHSRYTKKFKYVVPINLTNGYEDVILYAIWAMPDKEEPSNSYVRQVWGAINFYKKLLAKPSILIGDFNSNAIWDKKRRIGNHTDVVDFLTEYNITSIYHDLTKDKHGEESKPTFFLVKNRQKDYHLDYCFVSESLTTKNKSIKIGKYDDWIKWSDHMPLWITL